jgi:hypothetical protein
MIRRWLARLAAGPDTSDLPTPELMRGFVSRAGLVMLDCRTDVIGRDAIAFLRKPD